MQNLAFAQNVGPTRHTTAVPLAAMHPAFLRWLMSTTGAELPSSLDELVGRPSWHQDAACRGRVTARFVQGPGVSYGDLRGLCERCPVRRECLEMALADPDLLGLWGGTNDRERRELRRAVA